MKSVRKQYGNPDLHPFYDKLLRNWHDCNFTLNLVKNNYVNYRKPQRSEFYDIFASLVLASTTSKISYDIALRCFEFLSSEL